MPPWITPAVLLHIGAGALWLAASAALMFLRRPAQWLLVLQITTALMTMFAGIFLWHARHAGPQGQTEHALTAGTVFALIALGLQLAIAVQGRIDDERLERGRLVVSWIGLGFLVLAAAAMVASRYA